MDPLSIAASAAGLATACTKIVATLYTWIDDTVAVDDTVSGLCGEVTALGRVLDSVSNAAVSAPHAVIAEIDPDQSLWTTVKATLGDIQGTLDKFSQLLAEIQKTGGVFGRGFLRRPTKQIRLSMRLRDLTAYRDRLQSYNTAMTSALQMVNVCLLIHNNSSQDAVFDLLRGLRSQIGRVELAMHAGNRAGAGPAGGAAHHEDVRISQNLRRLVRVAHTFHYSASTIVRDGPRSTVWGGSVLGDPLTPDQVSNIERWIPPPTIEEDDRPQASAPESTGLKPPHHSDSDDDDVDKALVKRLEELAVDSARQGDYAKAENFYRKVLDRVQSDDASSRDLTATKISLAYTYLEQRKWAEAEDIINPIAFGKDVADVAAYTALHVLALAHVKTSRLEDAEKCCKRALWGRGKILGRANPLCWESLALLARICEAKNDPLEAEAHRSFLPASYYPQAATDLDPLEYLHHQHADIAAGSGSAELTEPQVDGPATTEVHGASNPQTTAPPAQTGSPQQVIRGPAKIMGERAQPQARALPEKEAHLLGETTPRHAAAGALPGRGVLETGPSTNDRRIPLNERKVPLYIPGLPPPRTWRPPPKPALIVGIHCGMEETAVALAYVADGGTLEYTINEWPNDRAQKNSVPSVIYYDQHQQIVGWGEYPEALPKPGIQRVSLLMPRLMVMNGENQELASRIPMRLPPGISAIDAMGDYLSKLLQHILAFVGRRLPMVPGGDMIHWRLVIPSICDKGGRAALRAAVAKAGMQGYGMEDQLFITEPEASIFTWSKHYAPDLVTPSTVIVVEAQKLTVNTVAYEVVRGTRRPLRQVTAVTGDGCGSEAVDRNFIKLLRARTNAASLEPGSNICERIQARGFLEFIRRIKVDFRNNGQNWFVDLGAEPEYESLNFPEAGIEEGYMAFTNQDIVWCFQPVVRRVLELVQAQIDTVLGSLHMSLQAILVTGSFSDNEFLFSEIKRGIPPSLRDLPFRMLGNPGSLLAEGAVATALL